MTYLIDMVIDKELLDALTEEAKSSPRLRMNYDLRTSSADTSQRMLNAIEPIRVMNGWKLFFALLSVH